MDAADYADMIRKRLQLQQKTVAQRYPHDDAERLTVRAELDALWECIEVLTQIVEGVPQGQVRVHDHFGDAGWID